MIIVGGPEARRGRNHGLVLEQVRTDDGEELAAGDYFARMGGYLTAPSAAGSRPRAPRGRRGLTATVAAAQARRSSTSSSGPPTIAVTSPDGSS